MRVSFSDAYVDTAVAFDTFRKSAAVAASLHADPIDDVEIVEPDPVDREALRTAHTDDYVDAVLTGAPAELAASNELGWDTGLARAVLTSTGGVRAAALTALVTGGIAGSLSSGLHHAHPGHGLGYCTVNGLAVAAEAACTAGARRVLILDLDAHCGGGTAAFLAWRRSDRNGARASAHEGSIEQVDVSVDPFDTYASTADARLTMSDGSNYLTDVAAQLSSIAAPRTIELVLYNAGMDPHHLAGGVPGIDDEVLARREQMVFDWADAHRVPVAWVLAGGYVHGVETQPGVSGTDIDGLVALHRLTVNAAARSAAGRTRRS